MASSSGTHTSTRMKVSIRKATKRFQKPTYSRLFDAASGKLDELFSKVFPLEQADECPGCILDALRDALAVLYFSARHPADELGQRLGPELHAVGDDEALDLDAVG